MKGVAVIKRLSRVYSLPTIYKSFALLHFDYDDVPYINETIRKFMSKTESIQYNVAIGVTVAIKSTSQMKF